MWVEAHVRRGVIGAATVNRDRFMLVQVLSPTRPDEPIIALTPFGPQPWLVFARDLLTLTIDGHPGADRFDLTLTWRTGDWLRLECIGALPDGRTRAQLSRLLDHRAPVDAAPVLHRACTVDTPAHLAALARMIEDADCLLDTDWNRVCWDVVGDDPWAHAQLVDACTVAGPPRALTAAELRLAYIGHVVAPGFSGPVLPAQPSASAILPRQRRGEPVLRPAASAATPADRALSQWIARYDRAAVLGSQDQEDWGAVLIALAGAEPAVVRDAWDQLSLAREQATGHEYIVVDGLLRHLAHTLVQLGFDPVADPVTVLDARV